ncbi:short chain dehydrogenase [Amycolatopsis xylanica]|uniref:Short chain dehydrogenase n=1 Tax=Amycolatopsis xylanica TaxID=589385 RepID=A0A1H3GM60_9PSEU|nr:SDR family NAD(P)-dependent oxidoreductase [Amycolatopsis xylanica]SDY03399.1 short chain dehydrogenase [Amycolatopsis xylanica]
MKTLAIFGAGPGLGISTARRFGKEGYRVALVSRTGDRLKSFVDDLAAEGVKAEAFTADLADLSGHAALVEAIGGIDVAVINGYLKFEHVRPTLDIDVESMRLAMEGTTLAPLSLTRLLLPRLLEQGDGGLLYGIGLSAKDPLPQLAMPGAAQASLRNYVHNLHLALADKGIYAGALTLGVLIERSDAQVMFDSIPEATLGLEPERSEPDDLAELYWDLYTRRDRAEQVVGQF